jgi:hypothetical protein
MPWSFLKNPAAIASRPSPERRLITSLLLFKQGKIREDN